MTQNAPLRGGGPLGGADRSVDALDYIFYSTTLNVYCYGFISSTYTYVATLLEAMVNLTF